MSRSTSAGVLGLGEQLDELARYLRRFEVRADRVVVELEHNGRRLALGRDVPEGEHDVLMLAVELLNDAAASLALIGAGP